MEIRHHLRQFLSRSDGSATIEFVLVFPVFIMIWLASFELGMLQLRHTMLERGLDLAIREVRISTVGPPSYDNIRESICTNSLILSDCDQHLKLEMLRMPPSVSLTWIAEADCIDRSEEVSPVREWTYGQAGDLMLVRVCFLFDPFFPTTGLGYQLAEAFDNGGSYALTAMTAFVSEPE